MDLYFIYYFVGYQKALYIESIIANRCLFTKFPDRAKTFTKEDAELLVQGLNTWNSGKTFYKIRDEYSSTFGVKELKSA